LSSYDATFQCPNIDPRASKRWYLLREQQDEKFNELANKFKEMTRN
jgi:hypothetical protein